jgi:predicted nuclease of predicted toxin-antitoxin system
MKFIADESVEASVVVRLRRDGHDCISIQEQQPGVSDDWVLSLAQQEDRVLLTGDKDFGEMVYRLKQANAGVVLMRLAGMSNIGKAETVSIAVRHHESELQNSFSVIEAGRIRIRRR